MRIDQVCVCEEVPLCLTSDSTEEENTGKMDKSFNSSSGSLSGSHHSDHANASQILKELLNVGKPSQGSLRSTCSSTLIMMYMMHDDDVGQG